MPKLIIVIIVRPFTVASYLVAFKLHLDLKQVLKTWIIGYFILLVELHFMFGSPN